MRPMLATRGTTVPTDAAWVHEVKWDGMRVLAATRGGRLTLTSRTERDVTVGFPELAGLAALGRDLLLDGEVVALSDGTPTLAALADRMHVSSAARARALSRTNPVTLLVFDLLGLDGADLTGEPLSSRRSALESLALGQHPGQDPGLDPGLDTAGARWQVPATYDDGTALQLATRRQGLEGVVSKRLTSRYRFGRRSPDWLKFPNRPRASYVVGGWRAQTGSPTRLGALLVGEPGPQGLRYRGRVGSGLAGGQGQRLRALLEPLRASAPPFCDEVPAVDVEGTRWVRPEVVVDVEALGLTPAGRLRQASWRGVRPDLSPDELGEG